MTFTQDEVNDIIQTFLEVPFVMFKLLPKLLTEFNNPRSKSVNKIINYMNANEENLITIYSNNKSCLYIKDYFTANEELIVNDTWMIDLSNPSNKQYIKVEIILQRGDFNVKIEYNTAEKSININQIDNLINTIKLTEIITRGTFTNVITRSKTHYLYELFMENEYNTLMAEEEEPQASETEDNTLMAEEEEPQAPTFTDVDMSETEDNGIGLNSNTFNEHSIGGNPRGDEDNTNFSDLLNPYYNLFFKKEILLENLEKNNLLYLLSYLNLFDRYETLLCVDNEEYYQSFKIESFDKENIEITKNLSLYVMFKFLLDDFIFIHIN